jgi:pyruvate kinase
MRHTKIIATIGPASQSDAVLDGVIAAGADVCRLNFSHGTHESHADAYRRIREAATRAGRVVGILQDLSGPKIRTGRLAGGRSLDLHDGDTLRLVTGDGEGGPGRVFTTCEGLVRGAQPGGTLLLDDGRIELRVVGSSGTEVVTTVVDGGPLGEHKGINAPGVVLAASALTPKDEEDLRFGLALGVDMVALSYVQNAADLRHTREVMTSAGASDVPLVAKLERPAAIAHLEEIFKACQGVMIARGDLGLEMPLETVPRAQKEITRGARRMGLPVILATQVLESMTSEARPTRAEVSDAANAVDDGVDAIMLAGETAVGVYPVRAVQMLDAIITEAEAILPIEPVVPVVPMVGTPGGHPARALCEAAMTLADHSHAYAIVAVTRAGATARLLSALRPRTPILAATDRVETARRLALYRGIMPLVTAIGADIGATRALLKQELRARGLVPSGAVVVFINMNMDLGRDDSNYVKLQRFE